MVLLSIYPIAESKLSQTSMNWPLGVKANRVKRNIVEEISPT